MILKVTATDANADRPAECVSAEGALGAPVTEKLNWQHFGFVSRPNVGDYILKKDGDVVASGSIDRPSINEGDCCLYSSEDTYIIIGTDNSITIENSGGSIVMSSDGDIRVNSDSIKLGSGVLNKLIDDRFIILFNSHTHLCSIPSSASATPLPQLIAATVATSVLEGR